MLQSVAALPQLPLQVLVAGRDNRNLFLSQIEALRLRQRVLFADPSPDVMRFYATADAYCGPSLHESFSLPPLEAMACGLPRLPVLEAAFRRPLPTDQTVSFLIILKMLLR